MSRILRVILWGAVAVTIFSASIQAQEPAKPPPFATTKVEGTDNVYIFRYGRPQAVTTYLDEIKKVTNQPVRYVIYSHHHFDHIAGGKPFKDAGATFIAHKKAKERLEQVKDPHTVIPDETVDNNRTIRLGDTTLELTYVGLNHSDSSIVMRLPKERIIFAVDFLPVGTLPGRGMIDFYPLVAENSIKQVMAMDWERLIPGHPGAPGGRLATKRDAQDQLTFLQDASGAVKAEAREGKCWEPAEKEMKLPKYENWPNYQAALPFVLRRYCGLWGRGT